MNEYQIELCGYNKQGELKSTKVYYIDAEDPCQAQKELLLKFIVSKDDAIITQHRVEIGYEYKIESFHGWIYRTHNTKRVELREAY